MPFHKPTFGYPDMKIRVGDEVEWGSANGSVDKFNCNCGRHTVSDVKDGKVHFIGELGPQPLFDLRNSYKTNTFRWFLKMPKTVVIINE